MKAKNLGKFGEKPLKTRFLSSSDGAIDNPILSLRSVLCFRTSDKGIDLFKNLLQCNWSNAAEKAVKKS